MREYLIDLNARAAALRAGYARKSAGVTGHLLLSKPAVEAAIQQAVQARMARVEVKGDDVLRHLMTIAFSDMRSYAAWDGRRVLLRNSAALSDLESAAVAEVSEGALGVKIKLHDKGSALALLMRHCNLLPTTRIVRDGTGRVGMEVPGGEDNVIIYIPDNGRDPQPGAPPEGGGAGPGARGLPPAAISTSRNGNHAP